MRKNSYIALFKRDGHILHIVMSEETGIDYMTSDGSLMTGKVERKEDGIYLGGIREDNIDIMVVLLNAKRVAHLTWAIGEYLKDNFPDSVQVKTTAT